MNKVLLSIIFLSGCFLFTAGIVSGKTAVTYISSEGVYINAGTNASLKKSDTLSLFRDDQKIALLVVDNISSRSSACTILEIYEVILIGDLVFDASQNPVIISDIGAEENKQPLQKTNALKKKSSIENRINGYVSIQQYYQKDFSSSSLSSYQPSLKTRFKIDNINGSGITFKIKHRSRYYQRSRQIVVDGNKNEWSHRIFEFALYSSQQESVYHWSFGRQSIYQMRGIGYIDGLYVARKISPGLTIGGAFGSEPDYLNQKIDFNRKKAAVYVDFTKGDYGSKRWSVAAAFAGSYLADGVNREFFNISTDYYTSRFTFNQSVEFDLFRSWRKEALGKTVSFANYYGRTSYQLNSNLKLSLSYDNRHQIRYFEDVFIADSLFDNLSHQGLKLGVNLKVKQNISLNGNSGIRFRTDEFDNNIFANLSLNLRRFPGIHNSVSFRFAYVKTMFTSAYRPSITYRFPIFKKAYLTLRGSSNMYKTGGQTTTNSYLDLNSYYSFSKVYFCSGSLRQYLDSELQSSQLHFELGRNF